LGALCTATPKELNNALEPAAIFEQAYMVAATAHQDRARRSRFYTKYQQALINIP
jgi:hypothetical protein